MSKVTTLIILFLAATPPAAAHNAGNHAGHDTWTLDPYIMVPLAITGVLFVIGALRLWRRSSTAHPVIVWRSLAFAAGWITLAGALVSPLHWLAERAFTFHMIEHEIIMAVSAPLVVTSRPAAFLLWGLPDVFKRWIGRKMATSTARATWAWLTGGAVATLLHGVAIWGWHLPFIFDAAVTNVVLHRLQHLSFFLTAVLFWWAIRWRSDFGVAASHLFVTMLHTALLGALIALAPHVLYHTQTQASENYGLTPLEDQQLAGIVMWIPAGTVYAVAALGLIALWIMNSSRRGQHGAHISSW